MDWLEWQFDISSGNAIRTAMLITFVLSLALALFLQRMKWFETALWACGSVILVLSAFLAITTGVGPMSPVGFGIMLAYLSIVAFPTTGIMRLMIGAVRKVRSAATPPT
jgi:hypothetical protein